MSIKFNLSRTDGPTVEVRQIWFGTAPALYIKPSWNEEADDADFEIFGVDLDFQELGELLKALGDDILEAIAEGKLPSTEQLEAEAAAASEDDEEGE